jgi:catechol 2,3-dioxygenase-like lactoylglutathione lyase family enzyme
VNVESLDHLVLTVRDVGATVDFYGRVLGMQVVTFGDDIEGPTQRIGAVGELLSVYVRDPDGNFVELANLR